MKKKLLILDLDETLLYATELPLPRSADFCFEGFHIYLRPFVREFIAFCNSNFHLAVWTSSSSDYADFVVKHTFNADIALQFLWARNRCTRVFDPENLTYEWVKDLKKVKRLGFDLNEVIMIDDTPQKLARNYGNLVRVKMFEGDEADSELPLLASYLMDLKNNPNIRAIEKRNWRNYKA